MKQHKATAAQAEVGAATAAEVAINSTSRILLKGRDGDTEFTASVEAGEFFDLMNKEDRATQEFFLSKAWASLVHRNGDCSLPVEITSAKMLVEAIAVMATKTRAGKPTKADKAKAAAAWEVLSKLPAEKRARWTELFGHPCTLEGCELAERDQRLKVEAAAKAAAREAAEKAAKELANMLA